MSEFFLSQPSADDINFDGFFDGQNKTIPNDTELTIAVTGGFVGIEEGKSLQVCMINIVVTTPGEFFGQKYKYNAKTFDQDAGKRDLAMRNLGVLDAQAGFPMTNGRLAMNTENIEQYWAGTAEARVKFGLFMTDPEGEPDGISREINFVRGFGYLREKMIKAGGAPVQQQEQQATQAENIAAGHAGDDPEIDF